MLLTVQPRGRMLWCGLLAATLGCSRSETGDASFVNPDLVKLMPVSGVVTLNHKPLAGAVVVFMPESGPTSVGETDKDGRYELESYGRKGGAPVGDYKVAVSYLVSADGEPQGLAARSSFSPTPGMTSAKEQLPKEYSDLGRTKTTAKVVSPGGTFDFEIDAPDVSADVKPTDAGTPNSSK